MSKINKIKVENEIYDVQDNTSGYVKKDVNNLTNYELKVSTANNILMTLNNTTYELTLSLRNSANEVLNTQSVDLPLETMVVDGEYDSTNRKIILELQNGNTIDVPVGDLINGLQSEITSSNKLDASLVDDSLSTNKFTNASEKAQWTGKYDKPNTGIPKTDLAQAVQDSLNLADSSLQAQDITGKEDKSNKVTSLDSTSTDTQYPSAKSVWDLISAGGLTTANINVDSSTNAIDLWDMEPGIYMANYLNTSKWYTDRSKTTREDFPLPYLLFLNKKIGEMAPSEETQIGFVSGVNDGIAKKKLMVYKIFHTTNDTLRYEAGNISSLTNGKFEMLTTTAQEITGTKTFLSVPSTSYNPTLDNQLARKKYVDDLISSMNSGATVGTYTSSYSNLVNMNTLKKGVYYPLGNFGNLFYYQINENGIRQSLSPNNVSQFEELIILKEQNEIISNNDIVGYISYVNKSGIKIIAELHYIINSDNEITGLTTTTNRQTTNIYLPTNFDGTKTQVLKNVNGTIQWVDE